MFNVATKCAIMFNVATKCAIMFNVATARELWTIAPLWRRKKKVLKIQPRVNEDNADERKRTSSTKSDVTVGKRNLTNKRSCSGPLQCFFPQKFGSRGFPARSQVVAIKDFWTNFGPSSQKIRHVFALYKPRHCECFHCTRLTWILR